MKLVTDEKMVANAFKKNALDFMRNYKDEEERRNLLCFVLEVLRDLKADVDADKVMMLVGLDPEMD